MSKAFIQILHSVPQDMNKNIVLCAGGTGGHINAALGLGAHFEKNGFSASYYTGERYLDYQLFEKERHKTLHLSSRPLRDKNAALTAKNLILNFFVFLTVVFKFLARRPAAVIGCGGYICGPVLAAGKLLGIRVFVIEQNAVAGLTNRLLAKIADKVFLNFEETAGISQTGKTFVAGNPVRSSIAYVPADIESPLKILAFGGSLGAKQINEAIAQLASKDWPYPVSFVHQVGKGNLKSVKPGHNVEYKQEEYLNSMDELYQWANVVVSRAGASTISELRIAKRPAFLVPYPFATDNHQEHNARQLEAEGAFYVKVADPHASPETIGTEIEKSLAEIKDKNLFRPFKECANVDSCEIIYKEVIRHVRN